MSSPVPRDDDPESQPEPDEGEAAGKATPRPERTPPGQRDATAGDQVGAESSGDDPGSVRPSPPGGVFSQRGADSEPASDAAMPSGDGAWPEVELGRPEARTQSWTRRARSERPGGRERPQRPQRSERRERPERGERPGRPNRRERSEQAGSDRGERRRPGRPDQSERTERGQRGSDEDRAAGGSGTAPDQGSGGLDQPTAPVAGLAGLGPVESPEHPSATTAASDSSGAGTSQAERPASTTGPEPREGRGSAANTDASTSPAADPSTSAGTQSPEATERLDRAGEGPVEETATVGRVEGGDRLADDTAALASPQAAPTKPARPAASAAAPSAPPRQSSAPPRQSPAPPRESSDAARQSSDPGRRRVTPGSPTQGGRRVVRRHATVRRVDPWSVLKLSLVFYFCILLVVMLGLTVFWTVVNQLGIIDQLLGFLEDLQFVVEINGGMIAQAVFLIGLLNVVLWSGINVFLAFLYNLVADLVGGLRVTLNEDQPG